MRLIAPWATLPPRNEAIPLRGLWRNVLKPPVKPRDACLVMDFTDTAVAHRNIDPVLGLFAALCFINDDGVAHGLPRARRREWSGLWESESPAYC